VPFTKLRSFLHPTDAQAWRCQQVQAGGSSSGVTVGFKIRKQVRACGFFSTRRDDTTFTPSPHRFAGMQVHYGETVKLVGSPAELGSWNVGAAPELTWSDGDIWTTSVDLAPGDVHFKVRHQHVDTGPAIS
jgi:Starch binding domain